MRVVRLLPLLPAVVFAMVAATPNSHADQQWSIHGGYDLIVVAPEKLRLRDYFSPRKFPNSKGREYPSGTLNVVLEGHPFGWLKFYSQSLMDTDGTALNTRGGVYNYHDVFQHKLYGAKFEEAFGEADLGRLGLKVGIQKFAWGKLDALAPNDITNPLEAYNPLLAGLAGIRDSEIGVPAVQLGYYLTNDRSALMPSETTIQTIWEPFYVPPRYDYIGERWFPPTLNANQNIDVNGVPIALAIALHNSNPPARLNRPTLGFRIANTWSNFDLDLYYYYGYQTGFRADATAQAFLRNVFPLMFGANVDANVLPLFKRLQSLGMAGATSFGPFGIRGEIAVQKNVLFARDLQNAFTAPTGLGGLQSLLPVLLGQPLPVPVPALEIASDAIRSGASADYSTHGYLFLLQVNETDLKRHVRDIITPRHETAVIGTIRKSYLESRLQFAINGLYSIQAADSFLEPTFAYQFTDNLSATLGYLKLAGPRKTTLGQFHDNDEVFLRARYTF